MSRNGFEIHSQINPNPRISRRLVVLVQNRSSYQMEGCAAGSRGWVWGDVCARCVLADLPGRSSALGLPPELAPLSTRAPRAYWPQTHKCVCACERGPWPSPCARSVLLTMLSVCLCPTPNGCQGENRRKSNANEREVRKPPDTNVKCQVARGKKNKKNFVPDFLGVWVWGLEFLWLRRPFLEATRSCHTAPREPPESIQEYQLKSPLSIGGVDAHFHLTKA